MHFDINSAAKMRNHLAGDVLDCKMLFLIKVFFYNALKTILVYLNSVKLNLKSRIHVEILYFDQLTEWTVDFSHVFLRPTILLFMG